MGEGVGRVPVHFPSYVNDRPYGLYDRWNVIDTEDKHERMQDLVGRVQRVVVEVATEHRLSLAGDQEESIALKGDCGWNKRRGGDFEKVKWLRVIFEDCLGYKENWQNRIGKARPLLGALGGVGNSRRGMNRVNWRATYTGMVRAIASGGIEIGWRGQKEWKREMTLLQSTALRKTLGVVKDSLERKVNAMAAVDDVETFASAASGRVPA